MIEQNMVATLTAKVDAQLHKLGLPNRGSLGDKLMLLERMGFVMEGKPEPKTKMQAPVVEKAVEIPLSKPVEPVATKRMGRPRKPAF